MNVIKQCKDKHHQAYLTEMKQLLMPMKLRGLTKEQIAELLGSNAIMVHRLMKECGLMQQRKTKPSGEITKSEILHAIDRGWNMTEIIYHLNIIPNDLYRLLNQYEIDRGLITKHQQFELTDAVLADIAAKRNNGATTLEMAVHYRCNLRKMTYIYTLLKRKANNGLLVTPAGAADS